MNTTSQSLTEAGQPALLTQQLGAYSLDSFNDPAAVARYAQQFGVERLCRELEADRVRSRSSEVLRAVSGAEDKPFQPKLDDLCRLHWLALSRKAVSVLEFGSGFSTAVLADAMRILDGLHGEWVRANLRCAKPFHLHSVEEDQRFLDITAQRLTPELKRRATLCRSSVELVEIELRIATVYARLPDVCPDFIYLDGPSQYATTRELRGISLSTAERMPMSADLLSVEFLLQPGTLVVVDGRTANARFLKSFFRRNWAYRHDPLGDLHLFELQEEPLGRFNRRQLEFSLPAGWLL